MSVETKTNPYLYLREDIHPPVFDAHMSEREYLRKFTDWHQRLSREQELLCTIQTQQVFGMLGVSSYVGILEIFNDSEKKQTAANTLNHQLKLMTGLSFQETIRRCHDWANAANSIREEDWKESLSYNGGPNLEMVNEICGFNESIDLVLTAMDGAWIPKARWDAKVKLDMINKFIKIDKRARDIKIEEQYNELLDWLNRYIWNPEKARGYSDNSVLISSHDPETWACIHSDWIKDPEIAKEIAAGPFQKKTELPRRSFTNDKNQTVEVYVTTRLKTPEKKVEKMYRKRLDDPAGAVDDDSGIELVFSCFKDIVLFIKHFNKVAYKTGYPAQIEDISYHLDRGKSYQGSPGSSPEMRMVKFFIRLKDNVRVECIVHTTETYPESKYMREVSHPEYRLKQRIESGLTDLIFRPPYFYFDKEESLRQGILRIRAGIEGWNLLRPSKAAV